MKNDSDLLQEHFWGNFCMVCSDFQRSDIYCPVDSISKNHFILLVNWLTRKVKCCTVFCVFLSILGFLKFKHSVSFEMKF